MSISFPVCALVFGGVTPAQGDVLELLVHLGCTDEVSSFECLLQNWDKKYSPGGTYPITVGNDGSVSMGRGVNCPAVLACTVEEIKGLVDAHGENICGFWGVVGEKNCSEDSSQKPMKTKKAKPL